MSTRAPATKPVTPERAGTMERPRAPDRSPRFVWIVAIVALLVGGLIGYLFGWAFAPTETTTVTRTVTKTVAPAAYTTSGDVRASVAFDGSSCMYAGPAEVTAGTLIAFTYQATAKGSGLIAWQVEPGTTYEQVAQAVARRGADNPPNWMVTWDSSTPLNAREQSLVMSVSEGLWVVSCATNPNTTNEVFLSTILRVVPS